MWSISSSRLRTLSGPQKMYLNILLLLLTSTSVQSEPSYAHGVHLPLYRRGGSFIGTDTSNLTQVSRILTWAESRYGKTYTDVEGNRIVRRWQEGSHGADEYLLDGAGNAGSWLLLSVVRNDLEWLMWSGILSYKSAVLLKNLKLTSTC